MHDVIVSGGGYNGISHGQKVSFLEYTNLLIYLLSLGLQKITMEGNTPRGTLLFRKGHKRKEGKY